MKHKVSQTVIITKNLSGHDFPIGSKVMITDTATSDHGYVNYYGYVITDPEKKRYFTDKECKPFKSNKMATQVRKPAARKVVAKKAAPKKASRVKYEPFNEYNNHEVTTDSYDPELITFGCGAVKVSRKDLRYLAKFADDPVLKKGLFASSDFPSDSYDSRVVLEILSTDVKVFKSIVDILGNKKYKKVIGMYADIYDKCYTYITWEQLVEIPSKDFLRLAATPKDRTC